MKYIKIDSHVDTEQIQFKIPVVGKETLQRLLSATRWPAQLTFEGPSGVVAAPLFDLARIVAEDSHPGDDVFGPQHLLNCAREGVSLHSLARQIPKGGVLDVTPELARAYCCPDMYEENLDALAEMARSDLGLDVPAYRFGGERAALVLACGVLLFEAKRLQVPLLFASAAA